MDAPVHTLKEIVTDFLPSAPTQEAIIAYRLPQFLQERAHNLLNKQKDGQLTGEEQDELNEFRQIDHLLTLIKAKARLKQRDAE